jgi:hypothetical protein
MLFSSRQFAYALALSAGLVSGCAGDHDGLSAGARNVVAADAASADVARMDASETASASGSREEEPDAGANAAARGTSDAADAGSASSPGPDAAMVVVASAQTDASQIDDASVSTLGSASEDASAARADAGSQPSDAAAPSPDASCTGAGCSYYVGNFSVDDSWGEFLTQPGELYLVPIAAPGQALLQTFGFFSRDTAVPATGQCTFAIYDDKDNYPNRLLTWSVLNAWAVEGESSVAPGSTGIRLYPGVKTWVGIACFHPSGSVRLRSKASQYGEFVQLTHTFGLDYPEQFPSTSQRKTGTALGVFLQVKDLP